MKIGQKNEAELLTYVKSKYSNPDGLHHYETLEYIHEGEVLIPEGIQVNESYQIILPDGSPVSSAASRTPVSNYEWESFLNEKKRFIKLPTPAVVTFMEQEFIDLAGYDPCPELDEAGNKKTKLSIVSKFLNSSGYVGVGGHTCSIIGIKCNIRLWSHCRCSNIIYKHTYYYNYQHNDYYYNYNNIYI